MTNFPTTDGRRTGLTISARDRDVTLSLSGDAPEGAVAFELPAFVGNIASASVGTVDDTSGVVTVPPAVRSATVTLTHAV